MHIYEPGLKELINKTIKNERLKFSLNLSKAFADKDFVFLIFDTKVDESTLISDPSKLKLRGWKNEINLENTIRKILNYWRKND